MTSTRGPLFPAVGCLAGTVALHDVRDVEAFVATVIRAHPTLSQVQRGDREDLEAEGFTVMCELARRHAEAYSGLSFAAYAWKQLPRRLLDWWRRTYCVRRRDADGRRRLESRLAVSWEAERERGGLAEFRCRRVGEFVAA